jgi:hypothetical protein
MGSWAVLLGWIVLPRAAAHAQCIPTLCGLTVALQSDASGLMLGSGGSLTIPSTPAYGGTVATGLTRTLGSTSWTVSTPFEAKVTCTNLLTLLACLLTLSPNYTLTAQLQSADSINTWKIGSTTLSSSSPVTLTSNGTYGVFNVWTLNLTIPFSEAGGTISNTINWVATTN